MTVDADGIRELARRGGDGLEVTLLWSARSGAVFVCVEDEHDGGGFHFAVDGAHALDAFRHPYAYAAESGRRPGREGIAGAARPTR